MADRLSSMVETRRQRVHMPTLEEYSERFKEFFKFERRNGILQITMHYDNEDPIWSYEMHHACAELFTTVGHDKENEVIILTSTGKNWIAKMDIGSFRRYDTDEVTNDDRFDVQIYDTMKVVENLVFDIEVPTIAAFNGSGVHWEMGMLMDITLAVPEFKLRDNHFTMPPGHVGGDGMYMITQELLGQKRANYFEFLGHEWDAQQCVDMGILNEIVPREKLLDRAWEIAEGFMKVNRTCRRLQHMLAMRPWQRLLVNDFKTHVLAEMYNKAHEKAPSGFDKMRTYEEE